MCFRFDACFGAVHDHDEDYCGLSAKGVAHDHAPGPGKTTGPAAQGNGHYYYYGSHQGVVHHGNGHRAPHHQLPAVAAAAHEEDRKASNDLRRGPAPAAGAAAKGGHGFAVGAAYVYSGAEEETLKQPPRRTKVVDGAGHGAGYFDERDPAHREHTAEYHCPPTVTTFIADQGRY